MADEVPVVVVKGADGQPLRINKSDYDLNPSDWELVGDEASVAPTVVQTTESVAPTGQLLVSKVGRKILVVDETGAAVTGVDGIDAKGYATEADAWAAVVALKQG